MLKNKVALITGAAGAIGRAISYGFADEGARLCLCDNDRDRLQKVAADLKEKYGKQNILSMVVDVKDPLQVKECVEKAERKYQHIDILVNNAAVTGIKKIDKLNNQDIDKIIDTNLKGYFYFIREVVKVMKKHRNKGVILIISSKNGLEGASEKSLYSATKGGEIVMARSLAKELGPIGIRVNTICPDAVHEDSKLWECGGHYSLATAKRYNITEDAIPEYYRERSALKVNIKPEDVSNTALFLASEQANKITGAILTVDGGVA